jgi:hypothetical protein
VIRLIVFAVSILVSLAACAVTRPLPTLEAWSGACRGVGLGAHITGSATDARLAWLVSDRGARQDVIWPPGYAARFTPMLEVLDETGAVVYRDGDAVSGGCTTGPDAQGPLLIAAGF